MRQVALGRSGIAVSDWALGTMTYGNQTPEADAHRQMDMARDAGITLLDTAEMYPVNPVRAETVGRSEEIVGRWLAGRGGRDRVAIATKVAGPRSAVREEGPGAAVIRRACEGSLRRLRTDRIDLYQIHWPERATYRFRGNWQYRPDADRARTLARMDEALDALGALVREGKVRAVGVSNETCWGVTRWLDRAGAAGPRVAAVQNEYSLLHRLFDTDMAEMAVNEEVTLLAYSPLAAGLLTGKYQAGAVPPGSRKSLNRDLGGRATQRAEAAVEAYLQIARDARMDVVAMALAWHRTRPFASIPILGATTAEQLARALKGAEAVVRPELAKRIDEANRQHPLPF